MWTQSLEHDNHMLNMLITHVDPLNYIMPRLHSVSVKKGKLMKYAKCCQAWKANERCQQSEQHEVPWSSWQDICLQQNDPSDLTRGQEKEMRKGCLEIRGGEGRETRPSLQKQPRALFSPVLAVICSCLYLVTIYLSWYVTFLSAITEYLMKITC